MRQIEDAERVARYLVNDIGVAAMETCAVNRRNRRISRRGEVLALVIAIEGQQFVLLPREVKTYIEVPVTGLDCR